MVFKHFSFQIGVRLALLTLVLVTSALLLLVPGYTVLRLVLAAIALGQLYDIFRFVTRTNADLSRFLEAVRYADFGQRFDMRRKGAGFEELGGVFTDIIERFQVERHQQEEDLRHLRALTDHVPVPLLSVHADGRLQVHNNAARRLLGNVSVTRVEELSVFGEDFLKQVQTVSPGERRLALFRADAMEQRLIISATEIIVAGRLEKLVSLQNIQNELDGVQLQSWQDLVRVLTHEIMNSITPVASLAKTAADLVDDAAGKLSDQPEVLEDLEDVKSAVETVARRSDGLMHFVESYRRLTRLPPPTIQLLSLSELFASVAQLVATEWDQQGIQLSVSVEPISLELNADAEMLEQVLLNLLQNSAQALTGREDAQVQLTAGLNRHGHVRIEVSDNGPGIPDDIAGRIFVPFFTTRREGSGVGLALTRQVMLAHGGSVVLGENSGGGAKFTLTF